MSVNTALAARFELIGRLIELLGEDPKGFRAAANLKAARIIADHPVDLATIAALPNAKATLQEIDGVGPKIADKVIEFCTTGSIVELDELRARVPPGLLDLLNIPGLGPKTVHSLWKDGGVHTLSDLKRIIADGSILSLPRMGEKSVKKILDSIAIAETLAMQGSQRLHLGIAMPIAQTIVDAMCKLPGVERAAFAGSARRGKETVGDLDILVAALPEHAPTISAAFRDLPDVLAVLTAGDNRSSVRVLIPTESGRYSIQDALGMSSEPPSIQVDLRVVPPESWGAALMYFTGSKEHNVRLRERAQKRGLTLNEYGLYPDTDPANPAPPQARGVAPIANATEADVYAALDLPFFAPELREDVQLPETAARRGAGKLAHDRPHTQPTFPSNLITLHDIRAELHAHTIASDGHMSILQLAQMAKDRGFHTIAVTDHSQSSAQAGGLKPDRLRQHILDIRHAQQQIAGITLLAGSEVDILADGSLDYDDDLLAQLDIVVASPHTALSQDPATATARLLKAIMHPLVHIIGHPTGRLINRRAGLSPDMPELIAAAKTHNVALEINAHWMRLDLRDTHVRLASTAGVLIAINCDVHEPQDYDNLTYAVATARRGSLTASQCINTWAAEKLHQWLKSKR